MSTRKPPTPADANSSLGFPPVCTGRDLVLVLGSFPGKASLQKQQYYGHPHNGFWQIMAELLGFDPQLSYPGRVTALHRNRVALWDVLTSCSRKGSLDSSILKHSMVLNDFENFFEKNKFIHTILFNGALAETEFRNKVLELDGIRKRTFELHRLPSTSPAMAMLSLSEKIRAWSILLEKLEFKSDT
jgi:hypoxanthine-DNA glycosylase